MGGEVRGDLRLELGIPLGGVPEPAHDVGGLREAVDVLGDGDLVDAMGVRPLAVVRDLVE